MANTTTNEAATIAAYNATLRGRSAPGGDLYIRPLTRAEMTAPLKWFEKQDAVRRRFGVRSDGTIGHVIVHRHISVRLTIVGKIERRRARIDAHRAGIYGMGAGTSDRTDFWHQASGRAYRLDLERR